MMTMMAVNRSLKISLKEKVKALRAQYHSYSLIALTDIFSDIIALLHTINLDI